MATGYGDFSACARCRREPTKAELVVWPELSDGTRTIGIVCPACMTDEDVERVQWAREHFAPIQVLDRDVEDLPGEVVDDETPGEAA